MNKLKKLLDKLPKASLHLSDKEIKALAKSIYDSIKAPRIKKKRKKVSR
jgi:hypothetical protein